MILLKQKADSIGAISSALCLIHCIATPFIFVAQSSLFTLGTAVPSWWKVVDVFFLVISFFAIYRSVKTTSSNWIKPALWFNWVLLFLVIINEKIGVLAIPESSIYIPSIALIVLHVYNRKYCQCSTENCCINEK